MEIDQWRLQKNKFKVSRTGIILYCTGRAGAPTFDKKLTFDIRAIRHTGQTRWIPATLTKIAACLRAPNPPKPTKDYDWCKYQAATKKLKNS